MAVKNYQKTERPVNPTTEARIKANNKYTGEKYDRFLVNVRKGMQKELDAWIDAKHEEDPGNPLYNSRNSLIIGLLRRETGLDL